MTVRITEKMLQSLVDRINELTGNPLTYAANKVGEPFKANIGNYYLEGVYRGINLVQVCNEGGGIHRIMYGNTKRDLYIQLHAFLNGLQTRSIKQ